MRILVPSVHHTGTKLVYDELLEGFPVGEPKERSGELWVKVRIHLEKQFLDDLIWWLDRVPAIVPLRHPRTVAKGWKFRAKRLEVLGEQWQMLKEKVDPYDPFYLPIDQDDRDKWLGRIGEELKWKFTTDWPVIGSCGQSADLNDKDEGLVKSWMEDGFFEKFGYAI